MLYYKLRLFKNHFLFIFTIQLEEKRHMNVPE